MKITYQLVLFFVVLTFTSCKKNDPEPTIDFTYSNNIGPIPDTVSFKATVENVSSVQWFFGDGGTITGTLEPKHVYIRAGYYNVQAIATGAGGSISRFKNVNVSPYTSLYINSSSTTVPALKPDGTTWDADPVLIDRNPDLRVVIYNSSNVEIMNDHYVAPNVFSAGFNYPTSVKISDFEGSFRIDVFDYDDPSHDDFIGSISFRPADYMTDSAAVFPNNFSKNNGMGLSVGVNLVWGN